MTRPMVLAALVLLLIVTMTPATADGPAAGAGAEEVAPVLFVIPMLIFWGIYMVMIPLIMLVSLASWVISGLAIYDCVMRDFPERSTQALWCILVFLTRWIGALIYYFAVYRPNMPPRAAR